MKKKLNKFIISFIFIFFLFGVSFVVNAQEGETIVIRPSALFTLDDIEGYPQGNGYTLKEVDIEIETESDIGEDYTQLPQNKKPITIYNLQEISRNEESVRYKIGIVAENDTNLYYTYFALPLEDAIDVSRIVNYKGEINLKHYFDESQYKHYLFFQKDLTQQCSVFVEDAETEFIKHAENLMIINLTDNIYTTLKKGELTPYWNIEDGIGYVYFNIKNILFDDIVSMDISYSYYYHYWFGVTGETFYERNIYHRDSTYEKKYKTSDYLLSWIPFTRAIETVRRIRNSGTKEIEMVNELPEEVYNLHIDHVGSKPLFNETNKWTKVALRHFPRLSHLHCNGVTLGEDLSVSDIYYLYEGQLFLYEDPSQEPPVQYEYKKFLDFKGFFKDLFKKNFFGYTLPKYYKEFILCLVGFVGIIFVISKLAIIFAPRKRYRR